MAKPGHYSRERDARSAARKKGLSDEQFELLQGPKGWTWREKKQYVKVADAKLHVKETPVAPVVVNEQVQTHPNIFLEKATGRYRWQDETSSLSMESYETIDAAEVALQVYCDTVLAPKAANFPDQVAAPAPVFMGLKETDPPPAPLPEPVPIQGLPVGLEGGGPLVDAGEKSHTASESAIQDIPKLEKRLCPDCKRVIDTFVTEETLRYIEHTYGSFWQSQGLQDTICNMSEEEVINAPTTGASQADFKPHELAQIQNGDAIPAGTFSPDSLPKRVVIPRTHRSTVESPSKKVWEIAEELTQANPKIPRKEVLAECVRRGIAYFTARTQYQVWLTLQKESAANQKEVNKEQ